MITTTFFKCRRCGSVFEFPEPIREEDIIFSQITIHTCVDTISVDGRSAHGVADMIGHNKMSDDVASQGEHHEN